MKPFLLFLICGVCAVASTIGLVAAIAHIIRKSQKNRPERRWTAIERIDLNYEEVFELTPQEERELDELIRRQY
jgi:hypothetical protein